MEYYAARVFYEEIKFFDPTQHENLEKFLSETWLNSKILKGDDVTDQESDVLNFLVDMIAYNKVKQNEMQEGGDDEIQSKSNTLNKLVTLAQLVNKLAYDMGEEVNLGYNQEFREKWSQNVILISCSCPEALA